MPNPSSSSSSNSLSAGAIAGIVIGSIVGLGLLVGLIFYCVIASKTVTGAGSNTKNPAAMEMGK